MVEEGPQAVVVAHLEDLDVLTGEEFLLDSQVAMEKVEFHHSQLNRKDGIWLEVIYLKISQNFLFRFFRFQNICINVENYTSSVTCIDNWRFVLLNFFVCQTRLKL